jgi:hypothetical protein
MEKRSSFQHLPSEENPQFLRDGKELYAQMRGKYPHENDKDLDNILNGLCAALTILMAAHVPKDNRVYMIQIIHKILTQNNKWE